LFRQFLADLLELTPQFLIFLTEFLQDLVAFSLLFGFPAVTSDRFDVFVAGLGVVDGMVLLARFCGRRDF
jgi:hypothetical protein